MASGRTDDVERDGEAKGSAANRDEERARVILESITDGFFAVDRTWKFTYVNPQAERLLDREPGELLGKVLWEAYPGLHGSEFERAYRAAMSAQVAGSVTAFYPDHDRWYEVHAYPSADGISVYFRDISEKKRADESLQQSNALLRGISDATDDAIFAKDRDGRFRFANPATLALLGRPLDQVLGRTDAELLGDPRAAQRVMDNDRLVMETGTPADLEENVPLADGTLRVFLSRKTPNRDAAGSVVGLLGVSRDVTDQKRALERISRLYQMAEALSEAIEPDDVAKVTVHQGTAAAGATAGMLALLTADGKHLELVAWTGYPAETMRAFARFPLGTPVPLAEAVRCGEPVYVESPADRARRYPALAGFDAGAHAQSSATIPLRIGGRAVGSLTLSFDRPGAFSAERVDFMISVGRQCAQALERARLFDSERAARGEAERASRMKDEFLATLSHELRTPLNAILGWATLLVRKAPSELRSGLETIQRNARAQTQIIEDLLDMSRIISGKVSLESRQTDLAEILAAAAFAVRPSAEAKSIPLRVTLAPGSYAVKGDPNRLQQVLWNLLHNAIKFTPRDGRVDVSLERAGERFEITVADTGEGIRPEFLPHVFDRFRQSDSSTTRRHGGLGLGLAIAKQLVVLHGGTIHVESAGVGCGSAFTVTLPARSSSATVGTPVSAEAPPGLQRRHARELGEDLRLGGMRVLVVDDEPDARALVKRILEDRDAVVRVASSAREAISLIDADPPDVLVSDIGMPVEDGYSLIRRVRRLGPGHGADVPAVALTAYARPEDRVRAIGAGYQSHVVKPIEPDELVAVVASLRGQAVSAS